jgi:3-oxoacyl-[acyl-carrier protein] reductase
VVGSAQFDFSNNVVLVTGSSVGIGYAIAKRFRGSGATVVINGRDAEKLALAAQSLADEVGPVLAVVADVRSMDEVKAMVDQVVGECGTIDVLVNNAGGNFASPLEKITVNGWRAVIESNLTSVFNCSVSCFPVFERAGGGNIINIGSVGGMRAHPLRSHYGAAKAGVHALTMTMGHEWAPYNIRVNCVVSGPVLTEASRFAEPAVGEAVAARIPMGRLGQPGEIADACAYLASSASSFMTGALMVVDGGPHKGY